jgi:starch phosphorylase
VCVDLGDLDPEAVNVEFYADARDGLEPERLATTSSRKLENVKNRYVFSARLPTTRPATEYTARLIPRRVGVSVPLEVSHILWQR